ncbi:MAG: L-threo-3-hydroxyaspartate ammonia-lyase [Myxococcota bacterium]|nr:L-threo-3-hydroxyaspartate ammonia-lyase [Myxococcota bacterium]
MSTSSAELVRGLPVTLQDIQVAAERIRNEVHYTPIFPSRTLSQMTGNHVFLKAENLQRGGAFKSRGACNKLASLSEDHRKRGVVTFSSGNHAQGVALAASSFGVPCVVVMPVDAPRPKVEATRGYGAEVEFAGRTSAERKARALEIAAGRGMTVIPPFDDREVIAGQGTIGLEILKELPTVEAVVTPVGGGGLIAGIAVAVRSLRPEVRIYGVEPEAADAMGQSLRKGEVVTIEPGETIADGLKPVAPGKLNFQIAQRLVTGMVTVNDNEIRGALKLLVERTKLYVEPSGAVGIAALLARKLPVKKANIVVVLSGGNMDPLVLASLANPSESQGVLPFSAESQEKFDF